MSTALTDTYGNYQNDMERTLGSLRNQVAQLQQDLPKMIKDVQPNSKEILNAVKSTKRVSGPQRVVVEVFAWSSVMVLASTIGSMLGAYILGPFASLFFGKFAAALLAFFIIPVVSHATIKNKERHFESDNRIRTMLLSTSIGQGALAGYAINSLYLSAQPLAFVTPAVVSVGYTISVRQTNGDRAQILGISLGLACLTNVLLGTMLSGNTSSYQFLTLGYVGIAGVIMQLVLHDSSSRGYTYQNALNSLYLLFKGATYYCFGTYIE
ncbi:hypothetical protein RB195_016648 [Necator americanus]|uniref:Uncharacterized protein n=1 Tax=Necator americanus TaxID=51031 RepID=A0ABR1C4N0_NECAM